MNTIDEKLNYLVENGGGGGSSIDLDLLWTNPNITMASPYTLSDIGISKYHFMLLVYGVQTADRPPLSAVPANTALREGLFEVDSFSEYYIDAIRSNTTSKRKFNIDGDSITFVSLASGDNILYGSVPYQIYGMCKK